MRAIRQVLFNKPKQTAVCELQWKGSSVTQPLALYTHRRRISVNPDSILEYGCGSGRVRPVLNLD